MILKTKVSIAKEDTSTMTEEEKENYQAKKEVLGDNFTDNDIVFKVESADAVIDTIFNHLYIDMGEENIRLRPLLGTDLLESESSNEYTYPLVTFKGNINEIYEQLIKENK